MYYFSFIYSFIYKTDFIYSFIIKIENDDESSNVITKYIVTLILLLYYIYCYINP